MFGFHNAYSIIVPFSFSGIDLQNLGHFLVSKIFTVTGHPRCNTRSVDCVRKVPFMQRRFCTETSLHSKEILSAKSVRSKVSELRRMVLMMKLNGEN